MCCADEKKPNKPDLNKRASVFDMSKQFVRHRGLMIEYGANGNQEQPTSTRVRKTDTSQPAAGQKKTGKAALLEWYVRMFVRMYVVCLYVVCLYVCMYICMFVFMCVCTYMSYVCMYESMTLFYTLCLNAPWSRCIMVVFQVPANGWFKV